MRAERAKFYYWLKASESSLTRLNASGASQVVVLVNGYRSERAKFYYWLKVLVVVLVKGERRAERAKSYYWLNASGASQVLLLVKGE